MNQKIFLVILICLIPRLAQASIVDAPHNETNNIKCASCHSYSIWWQHSPSTQNPAPDHTTIVNTVCMACHDEGGSAPAAVNHSAFTIDSNTYHNGDWAMGCTVCHDPHYQGQLAWAGTADDPYLIIGTMSNVLNDSPQTGQTTITYTATTSDPNWPADGTLPTDQDWGNKNGASRGLIFVHDKLETANTFAIISATSTDIVIKGDISSEQIDPATEGNSATSNTFALIYGQLIKDEITTPFSGIKPVKFFDANGGFVDANAEGICQVCHTQTIHYQNDGVLPSGLDTHVDRDNTDCINCHKHTDGFKGLGHDASQFGYTAINGLDCSICHQTIDGDIIAEIHNNTCGTCHVSAGGGGALTTGSPLNGVDGDAVGETGKNYTSTCNDCHNIQLKPAINSIPDIHHLESPNNYAPLGQCTECHISSKLAADHSTVIAPSLLCATTCHPNTAGSTAGAPVDPVDDKVHDACTTCHNTDSSLKAPYGQATALPAGTSASNDGGGECTTCHTTYFSEHTHDHNTAVRVNSLTTPTTSNCTGCHTASTPPYINTSEVHGVNACGTCHDLSSDGSLRVGIFGDATVNNSTGGECNDCHYNHFDGHDHGTSTGNNSHYVNHDTINDFAYADVTNFLADDKTDGNTCGNCHAIADWDSILVVHDKLTNGSGSCATCHNSTASVSRNGVVPNAPNETISEVISRGGVTDPITCKDCHWDNQVSHVPDHSLFMSGFLDADLTSPTLLTTCATNCHQPNFATSNIDPKIHDSCLTCHDGVTSPVNLISYAANHYVPENSPFNTCNTCHGVDTANIHILTKDDHSGQVMSTSNNTCDRCHTSDLITGVHKNNCDNCHESNNGYILRAGIKGDATNGPGNCNDCHGTNFLTIHPSTIDHSTLVAGNTECTNCHDATAGTTSGIPTSLSDNKIHDECATCHNSDGTLRSLAIGNGGGADCTTCHFASFDTHVPVTHSTRVSAATNCAGCHDSTAGTSTTIPTDPLDNKVHDACNVCHDSAGVLIGSANGNPAPNDCSDCHFASIDTHAQVNHSVLVAENSSCTGCHNATAGTTSGIPTSLSDNKIHDECATCHNSDGTLRSLAIGNGAGADCTTCHGTSVGAAHHNSAQATNGNCISCHQADVGQPGTSRANGNLDMPPNLACNFCHLYFPNNGYNTDGNGKVEFYSFTFDPDQNPSQGLSNVSVISSHTISTNASQPISDYSACFACHGATSYTGSQGTAPKVTPFHGFGTPYTNDSSSGGCVSDQDTIYQYAVENGDCGSGANEHTEPLHPGFGFLYGLSDYVRLETGPFGYYSSVRGGKNFYIHDGDINAHTLLSGNGVSGTFEVPWDNYDANEESAPVDIQLDVGTNGTLNVTVELPLVNLSLQ